MGEREFHFKILGRTLEHLGVQMYKHRDVAIAELVANCWDAGAERVEITIPTAASYSPTDSEVVITDDGLGMSADQVQDEYLVVGRNRRQGGTELANGRLVMGRKGIGKLAAFGIASRMTILTWRDGVATTLELEAAKLVAEPNDVKEVQLPGMVEQASADLPGRQGTRLTLAALKHRTAPDVQSLIEALGRRFSRTVLGQMKIYVNGAEVTEPHLDLEQRIPAEEGAMATEILSDGNEVRYFYGFAQSVIHSTPMRGFTVHVHGKTAQAPPFFFQVEAIASGQHGTRYLIGAIEADFLDAGTDTTSDRISTDRQEIDWEHAAIQPLLKWGQDLTRKALRDWAARNGERTQQAVEDNAELRARIERLDRPSQGQVRKAIRTLGQTDPAPDRVLEMADAIVRAYEYRQFFDVTEQIENASTDPADLQTLLCYLAEWKVMESRAILEIIRGRLQVIDKFHQLLVNDAPETAHRKGDDNLHDLLAEYPWLLNPEWQVLAEEKQISTQLREWNHTDVHEDDARLRYDFLALCDDRRYAIIEIKRSGHHLELDDVHRLSKYGNRLGRANPDIVMMMVCHSTGDLPAKELTYWNDRSDFEIRTWKEVYERTRRYYDHYRAVLEGEVEHRNFASKEHEVANTRRIIQPGGVHRGVERRQAGLGPQDVDYTTKAS